LVCLVLRRPVLSLWYLQASLYASRKHLLGKLIWSFKQTSIRAIRETAPNFRENAVLFRCVDIGGIKRNRHEFNMSSQLRDRDNVITPGVNSLSLPCEISGYVIGVVLDVENI